MSEPITHEEARRLCETAKYGVPYGLLRYIDQQDSLAQELTKKCREYEADYILPVFAWAKEMGIDLPALVNEAKGNCVERLFGALRGRIQELEAVVRKATAVVEACVAWQEDTGSCHFCGFADGEGRMVPHDCPLVENGFIDASGTRIEKVSGG